MSTNLERALAKVATLQLEIAALKAASRAEGCEPIEVEDWSLGLTLQEAALLAGMVRVYPRYLNAYAIDELVPHIDHAADRNLKLAALLVHRLRKKLGHEAIETAWGRGYRVSPAEHARLTRARLAQAA